MGTRRHLTLAALAAPGIFAWLACSTFTEDSPPDTPDAAADSQGTDGGTGDGGGNADAGEDDLLSFTDTKNWEMHTIGGSVGFTGAVFDGTRVIFSPKDGNFASYDPALPFDDGDSWKRFDVTLGGAKAAFGPAFGPGVVSSGYAYFPAWFNDDPSHISTTSARYELAQDFQSPTAWRGLDTTTPTNDAGLAPFSGAFLANGKPTFFPYAKVVGTDAPTPYFLQPPAPGTDFGDLTLWQKTDTTSLFGGKPPSCGGVAVVGDKAYSGDQVTQVLVQLPLTLATAAVMFDSSQLNGSGNPFATLGTVTDGHFVYFVPFRRPDKIDSGNLLASTLVRYDTDKSFTDPHSFETFDLATLTAGTPAGFCGATFDGRFVYFVPFGSAVVVRYDTTKSFRDPSSYETFAASGAVSALHCGAAFDGQYVYFSPFGTLPALRFKTRKTKASWPVQASSF